MYKASNPLKLASLYEFINACKIQKGKWNAGNALKQKTQESIGWYLKKLPKFEKPIKIKFIWVSEVGDQRDLDNICFAKKFILDAMQEQGIITNDNRKHVVGFTDEFTYGDSYIVDLEIEEVKCFKMEVEE